METFIEALWFAYLRIICFFLGLRQQYFGLDGLLTVLKSKETELHLGSFLILLFTDMILLLE